MGIGSSKDISSLMSCRSRQYKRNERRKLSPGGGGGIPSIIEYTSLVADDSHCPPHVHEDAIQTAVGCVPYKYQTTLAKYIIRRPYGFDSSSFLNYNHPCKSYSRNYNHRAYVESPSSIEVIAIVIQSDNNDNIQQKNGIFLLSAVPSGDDFKHKDKFYRWNQEKQEWEDCLKEHTVNLILHVEECKTETSLFSLKDVLEGAMLGREHYCRSVLGIAEAFMQWNEDDSVLDALSLPIPPSSSLLVGSPSLQSPPATKTTPFDVIRNRGAIVVFSLR